MKRKINKKKDDRNKMKKLQKYKKNKSHGERDQ